MLLCGLYPESAVSRAVTEGGMAHCCSENIHYPCPLANLKGLIKIKGAEAVPRKPD